MPYKIIILLAVLFTGSITASPNRCCDATRCTGKPRLAGAAIAPVKAATMMMDDTELLPIHQYFSNF